MGRTNIFCRRRVFGDVTRCEGVGVEWMVSGEWRGLKGRLGRYANHIENFVANYFVPNYTVNFVVNHLE